MLRFANSRLGNVRTLVAQQTRFLEDWKGECLKIQRPSWNGPMITAVFLGLTGNPKVEEYQKFQKRLRLQKQDNHGLTARKNLKTKTTSYTGLVSNLNNCKMHFVDSSSACLSKGILTA